MHITKIKNEKGGRYTVDLANTKKILIEFFEYVNKNKFT